MSDSTVMDADLDILCIAVLLLSTAAGHHHPAGVTSSFAAASRAGSSIGSTSTCLRGC